MFLEMQRTFVRETKVGGFTVATKLEPDLRFKTAILSSEGEVVSTYSRSAIDAAADHDAFVGIVEAAHKSLAPKSSQSALP